MARPTQWQIAEMVIPFSRRTLLYGPPGTGKTYTGEYLPRAGKEAEWNPDDHVESLYFTEYTSVSEPRGTILPVVEPGVYRQVKKGEFLFREVHPGVFEQIKEGEYISLDGGSRVYKWFDGPATIAARHGKRLVINEIDKASDDCITFLLNLLDDEDVALITLPTGEVIKPHPEFNVVATMNGDPQQLVEALRDRFPVAINIDTVNPAAINALPEDLREAATATATAEAHRRRSVRSWKAYNELRTRIDGDMAEEYALYACFGHQAPEMVSTLNMYRTREAKDIIRLDGDRNAQAELANRMSAMAAAAARPRR